jgi:GMP synthase-like glutamine amidotransferase
MKVHCLQHEPFEGMAAIETWLRGKNFEITFTRFFEPDILPVPADIDWLIIMGGAMSVNDEKEYPWLVKEKVFVRQCIEAGKVVVGICLGSQLIANALGAKVYRNSQKEIGWFPIRKSAHIRSKLFDLLPEEVTVFHWHGETFDLPEGAELIASSEACKNQIFVYGEKTIAFQCHLETTDESLASINGACRAELTEAPFIQTEAYMTGKERLYAAPMHEALYGVLERLL